MQVTAPKYYVSAADPAPYFWGVGCGVPQSTEGDVGPGPEFSGGFWDWANKINNGGRRQWTDPSSGVRYYIDDSGKIKGVVPKGGMAPTPGFSKGVKIIQYGGHTLEKSTLNALRITKEEGKFGIESMKKANQLPPDFHGNIGIDGSFWSKTGEYIDNILDYLY